jgi:hypothetical protein
MVYTAKSTSYGVASDLNGHTYSFSATSSATAWTYSDAEKQSAAVAQNQVTNVALYNLGLSSISNVTVITTTTVQLDWATVGDPNYQLIIQPPIQTNTGAGTQINVS